MNVNERDEWPTITEVPAEFLRAQRPAVVGIFDVIEVYEGPEARVAAEERAQRYIEGE